MSQNVNLRMEHSHCLTVIHNIIPEIYKNISLVFTKIFFCCNPNIFDVHKSLFASKYYMKRKHCHLQWCFLMSWILPPLKPWNKYYQVTVRRLQQLCERQEAKFTKIVESPDVGKINISTQSTISTNCCHWISILAVG